jgi:hypothetical protein
VLRPNSKKVRNGLVFKQTKTYSLTSSQRHTPKSKAHKKKRKMILSFMDVTKKASLKVETGAWDCSLALCMVLHAYSFHVLVSPAMICVALMIRIAKQGGPEKISQKISLFL